MTMEMTTRLAGEDYNDEEMNVIIDMFKYVMTNHERFDILKKENLVNDFNHYVKMKMELYKKILYERKKEVLQFSKDDFEIIKKGSDESCLHEHCRIESHKHDDKGGCFTCPKCGLFAYIKK